MPERLKTMDKNEQIGSLEVTDRLGTIQAVRA